MIWRGKVIFKLTSNEVFVISVILHMLDIYQNLVSVSLLGKIRVKITFKSNKIMLTKNDVFVGKKIIVVEACLCYKFMKLLLMVGSCKL